MDNETLHVAIFKMMQVYEQNLLSELETLWSRWKVDLSMVELHEVVGAIIARQCTLAIQLARSPGTWNYHTAPLFLRAMADNHISLSWILKEPQERAKKFILFGLGQAKLQNEHRKTQLKADGKNPEVDPAIREFEAWINSQRYEFLTEVNVAPSWSGLSVRSMAEEAGCVDFFNYVYQPFSAVAHNSWLHIARFNLTYCENPLHRHHRLPIIPELDSDIELILLAAKYANKSITSISEKFTLARDINARDILLADLKTFNDSIRTDKE